MLATVTHAAAPLASDPTTHALTLYGLATTTGSAQAYQVAAHALERALRYEVDKRHNLRPVRTAQAKAPALQLATVDGEPVKARRPRKAKGEVEALGENLCAILARIPRNRQAVGRFVCRWADGTETFVSGVIYRGDKPDTRWPAAFQAADRLRRMRSRNAYAQELDGPGGLLVGRYAMVGGHRRETDDWRRLISLRPMPALHSITDADDDAESFLAPVGSAFGGGDEAEALQLEAAVCRPNMPWLGWGEQPWTAEKCALIRGEIAQSFRLRQEAEDLEREPTPLATAEPGASCAGLDRADVEGRAVVVDLEYGPTLVAEAEAACDQADTPMHKSMAKVALQVARDRANSFTRHAGTVGQWPVLYTAHRYPGGLDLRDSTGRRFFVRSSEMAALRFAREA